MRYLSPNSELQNEKSEKISNPLRKISNPLPRGFELPRQEMANFSQDWSYSAEQMIPAPASRWLQPIYEATTAIRALPGDKRTNGFESSVDLAGVSRGFDRIDRPACEPVTEPAWKQVCDQLGSLGVQLVSDTDRNIPRDRAFRLKSSNPLSNPLLHVGVEDSKTERISARKTAGNAEFSTHSNNARSDTHNEPIKSSSNTLETFVRGGDGFRGKRPEDSFSNGDFDAIFRQNRNLQPTNNQKPYAQVREGSNQTEDIDISDGDASEFDEEEDVDFESLFALPELDLPISRDGISSSDLQTPTAAEIGQAQAEDSDLRQVRKWIEEKTIPNGG